MKERESVPRVGKKIVVAFLLFSRGRDRRKPRWFSSGCLLEKKRGKDSFDPSRSQGRKRGGKVRLSGRTNRRWTGS